MATIFDGRAFASEKQKDLKARVIKLKQKRIIPCLASILVGNNPASKIYVELKRKAAKRIGAELDIYYFSQKEEKEDLITLIESLNEDKGVHGIMIQLPLPEKLEKDRDEIIEKIIPQKDIDGLKAESLFLHPTSKAVIQILEQAKISQKINSKKVCVVGSSGMVGRPLVKELKKEGYEVSECDSQTKDLKEKTLEAEVLISTTGKPGLIKESMIKNGTIVIDVGSPKGDVDFEGVSKKASFITPVPGGVGPVPISCLLENLVASIEGNLIQ